MNVEEIITTARGEQKDFQTLEETVEKCVKVFAEHIKTSMLAEKGALAGNTNIPKEEYDHKKLTYDNCLNIIDGSVENL